MGPKELPDDASHNALGFLGTLRKRRLEEAEVVSEPQGSVQTGIPLETVFKGLVVRWTQLRPQLRHLLITLLHCPRKGCLWSVSL